MSGTAQCGDHDEVGCAEIKPGEHAGQLLVDPGT
jgi:hypothetical protein